MNVCVVGFCLKTCCKLIKSYIIYIFQKTNIAVVRYKNNWNSDTSKENVQIFYEVFRILENPRQVD